MSSAKRKRIGLLAGFENCAVAEDKVGLRPASGVDQLLPIAYCLLGTPLTAYCPVLTLSFEQVVCHLGYRLEADGFVDLVGCWVVDIGEQET